MILMVEDESGIRDNLRGFLQKEGFQVLTANSSGEALERVLKIGLSIA